MANPFKSALGGPKGPQNGPMNMMQAFQQFMGQMKGEDPNQLLNELVSSGKVNQDQLNQAQQMAKQISSQFDGMKSMFGFK